MIFEVGNGNPLQYSCLENPMDRGAWWATVCHGVTKQSNMTKRLSTHTQTTLKISGKIRHGKLILGSLYISHISSKGLKPTNNIYNTIKWESHTNPEIGVSGHNPSKAWRTRVSPTVKENVERQRGLLRALVAGEAKHCQEVLNEEPSRAGSTQHQNFRWICCSRS